jgi:thiol-disulfide isomerase/thioredoxin
MRHASTAGAIVRAVLCTVAGVAVCTVTRVVAQVPARTPEHAPSADLQWALESMDGRRQTLESFRGHVVVVNAWATWCEPCVAELRSFGALRAAIPDTGLVFALVASQRREPVAAFIRRRGLTLPVYLELSPAPRVYAFDAVPTTWIIDRSGRIAFRHRGAMRWDTDAVRALLTTLLAEPQGGGNRSGPAP